MNHSPESSVSTLPPPPSPTLVSAPTAPPLPDSSRGPRPDPKPAPPLRVQAAMWLRTKGIGSRALAITALGFAALAALVFLMHHPAVAGLLGGVALAAGELSLVRTRDPISNEVRLAWCVNPLVDLVMIAGIVAGIASFYPLGMVAAALAVFVLMAWLPLLRLRGGVARVPVGAGLWKRADRMGILLAGMAMGRVGFTLFVLTTILALDAWLCIERIDRPVALTAEPRSPFMDRILRPDGSLVPAVRWTTLGVTVLLLLVLPQSEAWRV